MKFQLFVLSCVILAVHSASFGEISQLAAQLGAGQGRQAAWSRVLEKSQQPLDMTQYMASPFGNNNQNARSGPESVLTTNPMSGFEFIQQLSNAGRGGKFGANKFGGSMGQFNLGGFGNSGGSQMNKLTSLSAIKNAGPSGFGQQFGRKNF